MKTILSILLVLAVGFTAQAQTPLRTSTGIAFDTVTNAASKTLFAQAKTGHSLVSLQINAARVSGTAGGTVFPVGSNDGVNFYTLGRAGDTLTLTNVAAQSRIWQVSPAGYQYYGLTYTGTGTMVVRFTGVLVSKP